MRIHVSPSKNTLDVPQSSLLKRKAKSCDLAMQSKIDLNEASQPKNRSKSVFFKTVTPHESEQLHKNHMQNARPLHEPLRTTSLMSTLHRLSSKFGLNSNRSSIHEQSAEELEEEEYVMKIMTDDLLDEDELHPPVEDEFSKLISPEIKKVALLQRQESLRQESLRKRSLQMEEAQAEEKQQKMLNRFGSQMVQKQLEHKLFGTHDSKDLALAKQRVISAQLMSIAEEYEAKNSTTQFNEEQEEIDRRRKRRECSDLRKMSIYGGKVPGQKKSSALPGKPLFQVNSLADAAMMISKEGGLARMHGENGFNRVVDLQKSHHTDNTHYTDPLFPWYILLPCSQFRVWWGIAIYILLMYYLIIVPLLLGFPDLSVPLGIEILFTLVFIIDFFPIQFICAYQIKKGIHEGSIETDQWNIAYRYLSTWAFIDLAATVPIDLIRPDVKWFRLFRLLRLLRLPRVSKNFDEIVKYLRFDPSVMRLVKLLVFLILMLHCFACAYWFICSLSDFNDTWAPVNIDDTDPLLTQYFRAILWAIWATTGTGFIGEPNSGLQTLYHCTVTFIGVLVYAFIIGSASSAMSDMDSSSKGRRLRLQQIQEYLAQRGLEPQFIAQIVRYYQYCWERHLDTGQDTIFDGLHSTLKRSMDIAIMENVILQVPMFRDISTQCLEKVIEYMQPRIYLPGEWVLIKGEWGEEMFFVLRGKFEVIPEITKPALIVLHKGQSFGEMSLLLRKKRNSSVRSINHGELMCLKKQAFMKILKHFPIFAISLQKWAPHIRLSKKWKKIQHAVRLCRLLHKNGVHQSFRQMMLDMNGVSCHKDTWLKRQITGINQRRMQSQRHTRKEPEDTGFKKFLQLLP